MPGQLPSILSLYFSIFLIRESVFPIFRNFFFVIHHIQKPQWKNM
jgi:hypothetical protein